MTLRIRHESAPSGEASSGERILDRGRLVIGRGAECDWVMPDPGRTMSKRHCVIETTDAGFDITDLSTNGVYLNDEDLPVGNGNTRPLRHGDRIRVGPYCLVVEVLGRDWSQTGPAAPFDASDGFESVTQLFRDDAAPRSTSRDPFAFPSHPSLPSIDQAGPLDSFFAPSQGTSPPPPPPSYNPPPASPSPASGIPTDWMAPAGAKPVAPPTAPPAAPPVHAPPVSTLPPAGFPTDWANSLSPNSEPMSPPPPSAPSTPLTAAPPPPPPLEPMGGGGDPFATDWNAPPSVPPSAAPLPPPTTPQPSADAGRTRLADPDLLLGQPHPTRTPLVQAPQVQVPQSPAVQNPHPQAPQASPSPPPSFAPIPPPATTAPVAPAMPGVPHGQQTAPTPSGAGWAEAFCAGAGVNPALLAGASPEDNLRKAGMLLRIAVEGLMTVLDSRRTLKNEFRLSATEFRATENNPLKFSVDVDAALEMLIGTPRRGYLPAPQAFSEAIEDIRMHEVAVLAGLQATWLSLLRRFDPHDLERRLGEDSGFAKVLGSKKARCWDAFVTLFDSIAGDANTEWERAFQTIFGDAYEQSMAQQRERSRRVGG